jgi:inositol-1,3,4-trisphosphate 5/6-kinase/inositol-tetrakisphosphate 1-kinase
LSKDIVDSLVEEFKKTLNLSLFGIDVIVEKGTGKHAVIDVNVFPGTSPYE